jgi:hypothetical protein
MQSLPGATRARTFPRRVRSFSDVNHALGNVHLAKSSTPAPDIPPAMSDDGFRYIASDGNRPRLRLASIDAASCRVRSDVVIRFNFTLISPCLSPNTYTDPRL